MYDKIHYWIRKIQMLIISHQVLCYDSRALKENPSWVKIIYIIYKANQTYFCVYDSLIGFKLNLKNGSQNHQFFFNLENANVQSYNIISVQAKAPWSWG